MFLPDRQLHVLSVRLPVLIVVFVRQEAFTNNWFQLAKITPALVVLRAPNKPTTLVLLSLTRWSSGTIYCPLYGLPIFKIQEWHLMAHLGLQGATEPVNLKFYHNYYLKINKFISKIFPNINVIQTFLYKLYCIVVAARQNTKGGKRTHNYLQR